MYCESLAIGLVRIWACHEPLLQSKVHYEDLTMPFMSVKVSVTKFQTKLLTE